MIVPLYREANIAAGLVYALGRLDYPVNKIDIMVSLEADDRETAQAFDAFALPPHWRVVTVPAAFPGPSRVPATMRLNWRGGNSLRSMTLKTGPTPASSAPPWRRSMQGASSLPAFRRVYSPTMRARTY